MANSNESNLQIATPSPNPIRTVTLLTLPTEILIEISQCLCLHCRAPRIGEIPHDQAAIGIHEQTALASLSASSKRLYTIAQPILFHFFHSLAGQIATLRRLTHFVHTLCHRPDLAASIRSLVLWTPYYKELDADEERPADAPHPSEDRDKDKDKDKDNAQAETPHDPVTCLRAAAVERLGPWWAQRLGCGPGQVARRRLSLGELQEVALALASGAVSYLLLHRRFRRERGRDWRGWTHPLLQGLRHVVLVGWRYRWPRPDNYTYHIKNARALLRAAGNLESLVAVDCGVDGFGPSIVGGQRNILKALPWDVELPRLRRLSINSEYVGVEEVEAIIRHSTVFEDLELFHLQYPLGAGWRWDVLDVEKHLGTAKQTLKRLCYSVFPIKATLKETDEEYTLNDSDDAEEYFDPTWHGLGGFEVGLSLNDFPVLETLELEQLLLYGPVFEGPDNVENDCSCELVATDEFLERFPPSLMRFRLGCIFYWPIVFRDMLAMAEERARFPKLRSVTLEVLRIPPREEFDYLVEAFRTAGIALSICSVVRDPFSRGLLPTRPGFPVRLPKPVTYTSVG